MFLHLYRNQLLELDHLIILPSDYQRLDSLLHQVNQDHLIDLVRTSHHEALSSHVVNYNKLKSFHQVIEKIFEDQIKDLENRSRVGLAEQAEYIRKEVKMLTTVTSLKELYDLEEIKEQREKLIEKGILQRQGRAKGADSGGEETKIEKTEADIESDSQPSRKEESDAKEEAEISQNLHDEERRRLVTPSRTLDIDTEAQSSSRKNSSRESSSASRHSTRGSSSRYSSATSGASRSSRSRSSGSYSQRSQSSSGFRSSSSTSSRSLSPSSSGSRSVSGSDSEDESPRSPSQRSNTTSPPTSPLDKK